MTTQGRGGRGGDQAGTAIVGTLIGFAILLVLLLFCVQIVIRLYATSTLTSVAETAANEVASAPVPAAEVPVAQAQAESDLGSFGTARTHFDWLEVDGEQVVLQVTARSPELLPGLSQWSEISRTVTIRTERFR